MIAREISSKLLELFQCYPFVLVTGPRQSGKTTLCRHVFSNLEYIDLESPRLRNFAQASPEHFLSELKNGAILDEVQRVPELLSYLKVIGDESRKNSLFVLTGSAQFQLLDSVTQSLAGRVGILNLLPLSLAERQQTGANENIDDILFSGFYPRIYSQYLDANQVLSDYVTTYLERDVRQIGKIQDLSKFQTFLQLCASRVGQLLNHSALSADAGVSLATTRHWITVLEASFIVYRLKPYFTNRRKRLVKTTKLYFYDVGLASYLLGIENASQMSAHPLRGALFENLVIMEAIKYRFNRKRMPNFFFYRDAQDIECDLIFENGDGINLIEIKSGNSIDSLPVQSIDYLARLLPRVNQKIIVYGGLKWRTVGDRNFVPLFKLPAAFEKYIS